MAKASTEHPDFFQRVYDAVRLVPYGRVTSYGAIAAFVGQKGAARMVGWAMNNCAGEHPPVPAHRVVNRNGMLSGKHHFDSPTRMAELLEAEGIAVQDDQVQDFERLFWSPANDLPSSF